ncbi:hypothetical protein DL93DRAFT_2093861 [Clavulina sp. PMI_390]|nr:hypothetical protein DL93DRAFT_2093861 [Clavulina sp. PMI_390]
MDSTAQLDVDVWMEEPKLDRRLQCRGTPHDSNSNKSHRPSAEWEKNGYTHGGLYRAYGFLDLWLAEEEEKKPHAQLVTEEYYYYGAGEREMTASKVGRGESDKRGDNGRYRSVGASKGRERQAMMDRSHIRVRYDRRDRAHATAAHAQQRGSLYSFDLSIRDRIGWLICKPMKGQEMREGGMEESSEETQSTPTHPQAPTAESWKPI